MGAESDSERSSREKERHRDEEHHDRPVHGDKRVVHFRADSARRREFAVFGNSTESPGCQRIIYASIPPTSAHKRAMNIYCLAIILWSVEKTYFLKKLAGTS